MISDLNLFILNKKKYWIFYLKPLQWPWIAMQFIYNSHIYFSDLWSLALEYFLSDESETIRPGTVELSWDVFP